MRITGGDLRGRQVHVPKGDVRPTQDRVRAALFNIIGARVAGARFLDLFAGSGAVGLEAWSRGAASVCWVESHRRTLMVLKRNIEELCGAEGQVLGADVRVFLKKGLAPGPYDVIFCDPPYEKGGRGRAPRRPDLAWLPLILREVRGAGALALGGLLVMEQASDEPGAGEEGWVQSDDRLYGGTRLRFFRQEGGA